MQADLVFIGHKLFWMASSSTSTRCSYFYMKIIFHIYPEYLDRWSWINNADPDQMPGNVSSNQSLHGLPFIQQLFKHISRWSNTVKLQWLEHQWLIYRTDLPASVVQLDACSTGDQVAGLTPTGSATFFWWDWSWNIFYGLSLPSADSRKPIVSFWWKNVYNTR